MTDLNQNPYAVTCLSLCILSSPVLQILYDFQGILHGLTRLGTLDVDNCTNPAVVMFKFCPVKRRFGNIHLCIKHLILSFSFLAAPPCTASAAYFLCMGLRIKKQPKNSMNRLWLLEILYFSIHFFHYKKFFAVCKDFFAKFFNFLTNFCIFETAHRHAQNLYVLLS